MLLGIDPYVLFSGDNNVLAIPFFYLEAYCLGLLLTSVVPNDVLSV